MSYENKRNRKFCVVEFPDERDGSSTPMGIIGSSWLNEDTDGQNFCYWPTYLKSERHKVDAICEGLKLETKKCMMCKVNVKYYADTYTRAQQKMEQLKVASSVSQTSCTDSESDEDLNQTLTNPSAKRLITENRKYIDFICDSDEDYTPAVPKLPVFPNISSALSTTFSPLITSSDSRNTTPTTSRIVEITNLNGNRPKSINTCSSHCLHTEGLLKNLLTKAEAIHHNQEHLIRLIQELHPTVTTDEAPQLSNLPTMKKEDLNYFEETLEDDSTFSKLYAVLEIVGGKDIPDTCRRIVSRLISHELTLNMNWTGRNDRMGFQKFKNIRKLIAGTLSY